MANRKGPVLIELEGDAPSPAAAPPVPEPALPPEGRAMQRMARLAARRPSALTRWFWRLLGALLTMALGVAVWDFVTGLLLRNSYIGYAALGLTGLFLLVCLAIILREAAGFSRLERIDAIHRAADAAIVAGDLDEARRVADRLERLYARREDLAWGLDRFREHRADPVDGDALLEMAEREVLAPIDAAARAEIEAAARQVATVTAIVPLAFADVAAALAGNLRMIRRIAELYGGRTGVLGGWRLTRSVLTHLVATGAVAVGDDLIGSVAGGGLASKISRKFGEGVVNGALTARVGIAAMEVCRPLPFRAERRPTVTGTVKSALAGLFSVPK
ncbi:MAG: TIGR01620 family protein [Rhodobacteraceae bacterium]|nr:TIGR01620 family protein [Paracoccaceae bacterium]